MPQLIPLQQGGLHDQGITWQWTQSVQRSTPSKEYHKPWLVSFLQAEVAVLALLPTALLSYTNALKTL